MWYLGSGVVLDCIVSLSLQTFLLLYPAITSVHQLIKNRYFSLNSKMQRLVSLVCTPDLIMNDETIHLDSFVRRK